MRKYSVFLSLILLCGCYDPHAQESRIVREVQSAGSGDLSLFSPNGLNNFFADRQPLALKISQECIPLFEKADVHWFDSAEGHVCQSAKAMYRTQWTSKDDKVW